MVGWLLIFLSQNLNKLQWHCNCNWEHNNANAKLNLLSIGLFRNEKQIKSSSFCSKLRKKIKSIEFNFVFNFFKEAFWPSKIIRLSHHLIFRRQRCKIKAISLLTILNRPSLTYIIEIEVSKKLESHRVWSTMFTILRIVLKVETSIHLR